MYRKSFAFSIHNYCIKKWNVVSFFYGIQDIKIKKEKNIKENIIDTIQNYTIKVKKKHNYFQIFQQVAVKNKINLKELIGIQFNEGFQNDKILNYISKNYPNIEIKITKMKNIDDIMLKKS